MNPPPTVACDEHEVRIRQAEIMQATILERIARREEVSRTRHDEVMGELSKIRGAVAENGRDLSRTQADVEALQTGRDADAHRMDTIERGQFEDRRRLWAIAAGGGGGAAGLIGLVVYAIRAIAGG